MMRELFALILLMTLIVSSFLNVYFLGKVRDELEAFLLVSEKAIMAGNTELAVSAVNSALSYWNSLDSYTHVVLKHDKLDELTAQFYSYLAALKDGDASALIEAKSLLTALDSLYDMERPHIGSIF